jgi:hypothetical protein
MDDSSFFDSAAAHQVERDMPLSAISRSTTTPRSAWSPDIWVMLQPAAAYQWLARLPASEESSSALRRPLFVAFLLGCMVSLITSQRLALRLVADGAINASFILLGQIGALALVWRRERVGSFARAIDLFFAGYGPWSLWILSFSAVWAFASPMQAFAWTGSRWHWFTVVVAAAWSGYIDLRFFQCVLQRSAERAARDLLLQWAISWSVAIVIFGGGPLWSEHMRMFGR